ncbi:MAG: hypothetical protein ACOH5I_18490 [Oligoflexus sp.]
MRKKFRGIVIGLLALVAGFFALKHSRDELAARLDQSKNFSKEEIENEASVVVPIPVHAGQSQGRSMRSKISRHAVMQEEVFEPVEQIASWIAHADLNRKQQLRATVFRLKKEKPQVVAQALLDHYRKSNSETAYQRDQVLVLAMKLNQPELLPLWTDVLLRETPRFADEGKHRSAIHPSLESRLIAVEQMQAIKALGELSRTSQQAHELLFQVVLNQATIDFSDVHREEALLMLQEVDHNAILKAWTRLDQGDQLRLRIKQRWQKEG